MFVIKQTEMNISAGITAKFELVFVFNTAELYFLGVLFKSQQKENRFR